MLTMSETWMQEETSPSLHRELFHASESFMYLLLVSGQLRQGRASIFTQFYLWISQ